MSYIGKGPGEHFTSFQTETFSVSATTSYTLSYAVANENELALFINNVRQQPGSGKAYTAAGTALTLSAATASTDTMYAIYLGRALQTITPSTNSITSSMLGSNFFTGATDIGGAIADADLILMDDGAGGTLRKSAASRLKTYIPGNAGTAVFNLYSGSNQSIANTTATKIAWSAARIDTASGADFTNNRWTVPSGYDGDYYLAGSVFGDFTDTSGERADVAIRINNTAKIETRLRTGANGGSSTYAISGIWNLNASDYVELFLYQDSGASQDTDSNENYTWLKGFKLNSE